MKKVVTVIDDAIKSETVACLSCERINLDYERFQEYRDSEEHKTTSLFEYPRPKTRTIKIRQIDSTIPSIYQYFLDGSRRTYQVADLVVEGRYLPLIAGQVGVAVLKRKGNRLKPVLDLCVHDNLIAFPNEVTSDSDIKKLSQQIKHETKTSFHLLRYNVKDEKDPVDLGIAKIMSYMASLELDAVHKLSESSRLSSNSLLIKDGPLRYKNIKGRGFDITQFRNVIGVSKTFRPSFAVGKGQTKKDVGVITSTLKMGERTPVFKTEEEDKYIGVWYLRIRPRSRMPNPLQGIIKVECYAIDPYEQDNGLDSQRINTISSHLLNERNATPFGADRRWATHLYPIYQTETYIKSTLFSDMRFKALF